MRLGVAGAGTMGAGIAQLGVTAGMETLLHDPDPEALERGLGDATAAPRLEDLAGCELIVEATPERRELKRELFERLSAIAPAAVLATNTSSIPVTALAGAASSPELVVGMHFFNPPQRMRLVEVIAADQTGERALEVATDAGERMGKRVIRAADGPGFLVNRCGRPFGGEALRLLTERVAPVEQIDRICRVGGGFRMGPFELMDLVGIDVGLAVAKSFTELSFGEPRWRPSPLQQRMVDAGRLGRKTGHGWYRYDGERHRPKDPPGDGDPPPFEEVQRAGDDMAWHALPGSRLVELCGRRTDEAEAPFRELGMAVEWLTQDAPGGVLGRIVCQLVNEAAFAIGEGVGSAADVDVGMELGLNHPRGPVAWGDLIGLDTVLATIDELWEQRREERYRAAPLLRTAVARGVGLEEAAASWPPQT